MYTINVVVWEIIFEYIWPVFSEIQKKYPMYFIYDKHQIIIKTKQVILGIMNDDKFSNASINIMIKKFNGN
jgi:hypothetical protein